MSKIKSTVAEDYDVTSQNDNSLEMQAEAELSEYINSVEARLAGFTSQELIDEYYRRMFEPLNNNIQSIIKRLDDMIAPF